MEALEIGKALVELCRKGQFMQAVETHYGDDIVSIEGASGPGFAQRMEGKEAILGKNQWWAENHEVHELRLEGPFGAEGSDRFLVYFDMDVTNKADDQRSQMKEVAIYTVRDGKIVQEEFFYDVSLFPAS